MNKRVALILSMCLSVVLFFAGCQSADQTPIPVSIDDFAPIPVQVMLARDHVLEYVSSSRLPSIPASVAWQLDTEEQLEEEYYFYSGNWLMIIWAADLDNENQQVIIQNKAEKFYWCGYVQPNGHVQDTSYDR